MGEFQLIMNKDCVIGWEANMQVLVPMLWDWTRPGMLEGKPGLRCDQSREWEGNRKRREGHFRWYCGVNFLILHSAQLRMTSKALQQEIEAYYII